ncbi:hypothetical protein [Mycolicibacterium murale]|uniref:hypothetical protein n=1 Tax=Mycolicibacterium murale TaxID=182220 RepID=UPI001875EA2D|nr:hypothetical protein [Mycolicibacterium murale]
MTNSSDLRSAYDITAAARAVQPVLREFSGFGDRHRRTADEVIEALEENGMFRLFTPADSADSRSTWPPCCR